MSDQNLALNTSLVRGQAFTFRALADAYMVAYAGRDRDQLYRMQFFVEHLGDKIVSEIDADDVDDCLQELNTRGKLRNRGGTKRGGEIVATHQPLANATINRYRCALQGVLSWARKKL